MNYRKFGNTTLEVSEIGFGAWAIGGNAMVGDIAIGWGRSDDSVSRQAIAAALDQGINFFDTADIYGLGHSEKLLGEVLQSEKDIVIATKVGNVSRDNQFTTDYSYNYILSACDASLKRLRRDVIDYYQLHSAKLKDLENGACIEAMQSLQQQGKIRYWGLSLNTFEPAPEAEFLMNAKLGSGFQLVFNLINQKSLPLIKQAAANNYGIIVRMPLQFGLLTGKFSSSTSFDKDDHRQKRLTKEIIERSNEILNKHIWTLCEKYNTTKTGLALSFILSYSEVSTVIPGIRTPQHAKDNTTGIIQLDDDDKNLLESMYETNWQDVMQLIQHQG